MLYGAKIGYQVATYSGEVWVCYSNIDTDSDVLIAKARNQLSRKSGGLPFGYENFWVIERDIQDDLDG
jgi:hypothetical protein